MVINNFPVQISVITAVFNRHKTIIRTINSLKKQTFRDFEHIIVDDGSDRKVFKTIEDYINSNKNVKYIKHSNRGTPLSLNTGIRLAAGKFLTFIDSDDEYKPDHLEKRYRYFIRNRTIDVISSNAEITGQDSLKFVPDANDTSKVIHLNKCIIGATIFGKKRVFNALNGFKNIFAYDYEFIQRASLKYKYKKIISPTYIYHRESPDSVLTLMGSKIIETIKPNVS